MMSARRCLSSRIYDESARQDVVSYERLQTLFRNKVNLASEDRPKLTLDSHEGIPGVSIRLELDQEVDITVWVLGHRVEPNRRRELFDPFAAAKISQLIRWDVKWGYRNHDIAILMGTCTRRRRASP